MSGAGALDGPVEDLPRLRAAGIATVGDVLARARLVRDLPDRSNHRLTVPGLDVHVKRTKGAVESAEARALLAAQAAGVPVARIAFLGADPAYGAIVGTHDLAPAAPLDDLLRTGRVPAAIRRAVIGELATAVAALHDAGLFPRDLYLNQVFVDVAAHAGRRVTLIDLERAVAPRWWRGRAARRELGALLSSVPPGTVSDREALRFLVRYLRARGRPRRVASPRAIARHAARLRRHRPRTPVSDRGQTPIGA